MLSILSYGQHKDCHCSAERRSTTGLLHFIPRLAMTLFVALLTTGAWAQGTEVLGDYTYNKDANGNYLLDCPEAYDALAEYVKAGNNCLGKTFVMTTDIGSTDNPITKPLGRQYDSNKEHRYRFAGTFDGGNHTLTIRLDMTKDPVKEWFKFNRGYCAPFAYTDNVTIKNLHVTGSITTTGQWASGLIGSAEGQCTITDCHVSVALTCNTGNSNGNHGGFVGIAEGGATITNCWFDGKLLGKNYKYSGGFIGLNKGASSFTNCLFNPSEINITNNNIEGACEFSHNLTGGSNTFNTTYFVTAFGEGNNEQGIKVVTSLPEGYVGTAVEAVDEQTYYIVNTNSEWVAFNNLLAAGGDVTLGKDLRAGSEDEALTVPAGTTVVLDLNGHTLDRGLASESTAPKANGYVIKVETGASLTIRDSSTGGQISGGQNNGNGGGICNEGTIVLESGSVNWNKAVGLGGGIYNGAAASLTITGGTIQGNNSTVQGGGIYLNPSNNETTYAFSNCDISRNKISVLIDGQGAGGALYVGNGNVTLTDCTLNSNDTRNAGGALYIKNGSVTATNCTMNMNSAYASATGGGVYLNDGTFTMDGGIITKNTCTKNKGEGLGVYVNGGTFKVKGDVQIIDNLYSSKQHNVYLKGSNKIVIDGAFTGNIGVSQQNSGVFTDGLPGKGDYMMFSSDNTQYVIGEDANGEAYLSMDIAITLLNDDSESEKSNAELIEYYDGTKIASVTLEDRTFYKDGSWNTLCLPFNLTISGSVFDGDGVEVRTLSSADYVSETQTLNLDFETVTELVAGTPYIIRWDDTNEEITSPTFQNVTLKKEQSNIETEYVDFVGTYSPVTLTANDYTKLYLGEENTLYYPSSDVTLNSFRTYFQLKNLTVGNLPSDVNAFNLNFGGNASAIDHLPLSIDQSADAWYTIDGRKLQGKPTAKGIYIVKGRKVLVK